MGLEGFNYPGRRSFMAQDIPWRCFIPFDIHLSCPIASRKLGRESLERTGLHVCETVNADVQQAAQQGDLQPQEEAKQ